MKLTQTIVLNRNEVAKIKEVSELLAKEFKLLGKDGMWKSVKIETKSKSLLGSTAYAMHLKDTLEMEMTVEVDDSAVEWLCATATAVIPALKPLVESLTTIGGVLKEQIASVPDEGDVEESSHMTLDWESGRVRVVEDNEVIKDTRDDEEE